MSDLSKETIQAALAGLKDPISGESLLESGAIKGIVIRGGNVGLSIDIASPDLVNQYETVRLEAENIVKDVAGVMSATTVLTAERASDDKGPAAPTQGKRIGQHAQPGGKISLPNIRTILVVASGKGGVGKSTVAVNIAAGLKSFGLKVGLLDADIYGPSVPKLLGINEKPQMGDNDKMIPPVAHSMKVMSMGFMVDEEAPLVWRGPMMAGAMTQLFTDTDWGELDVLVVDMPPGTGDAQLTLAQRIPVTGAVIVSTPQDIALIDAKKGFQMFQKTDVPIFGIVENMSYYACPKCGDRAEIFGHGGAKETAENYGVEFLGGIPLHISVREKSDQGSPAVLDRNNEALREAFLSIAEQVQDKLLDAM